MGYDISRCSVRYDPNQSPILVLFLSAVFGQCVAEEESMTVNSQRSLKDFCLLSSGAGVYLAAKSYQKLHYREGNKAEPALLIRHLLTRDKHKYSRTGRGRTTRPPPSPPSLHGLQRRFSVFFGSRLSPEQAAWGKNSLAFTSVWGNIWRNAAAQGMDHELWGFGVWVWV